MVVLNNFLVKVVTEIINPIILLLATGAFIAFVWGVVQFIYHAGDEKRQEAREAILWGLVGLVIIFGVYGILNLVTGTFNLPPPQKISTPA